MLDEMITDEALALKDALKEKRDKNNITNQEIADRSGPSIHTVTNYFSSRSKASSAFTVGKICMALNMSFDQAFGIVPEEWSQRSEDLAKIADLEQDAIESKKEADHNQKLIEQLKKRISNLRIFSYSTLIALFIVLGLFIAYLICFDLPNPDYGIIRSEAFVAVICRAFVLK